ncbi:MAG TPA: gas vesicle protein GvpG [Vicinamibacterales bacterium]|jgi:Gas vesicle protein G|nr:gas vesicle protein GvpG [Vicinamibacterales bacterium]
MFILDSLLVGGLRFVLDKVAAAAEAELHDDSALREQLLEARMRLELGEITQREFDRTERDLLERIREIRGTAASGAVTMSGDVTVDLQPFDEPAASRRS